MPPKVLLEPRRYQSVRVRSRGYLPHWELDEGLYFVTFRLADSLPRHVLVQLEQDRQTIIRMVTRGKPPTAIQNTEIRKMFGLRIDQDLDFGYGACHLRNSEAADVVAGALRFFHGSLYDLIAPFQQVTIVNRGEEPSYFSGLADILGVPSSSLRIFNDGFADFVAATT